LKDVNLEKVRLEEQVLEKDEETNAGYFQSKKKHKGPHFLERILYIDYKKMEGCSVWHNTWIP
jgi:hypothetical protein